MPTTIVVMALSVSLACLLAVAVVVRRRRRRNLMALHWEGTKTKAGFIRKCRIYFKADGWTIREPWAAWTDLLVRKDDQEIHLMCAEPRATLEATTLWMAYEAAIGCGQCVLLLCWTPPTDRIRIEAKTRRVPILHYKEIPRILDYVRGFMEEQRLQSFPSRDLLDDPAATVG